MQLWGSFSLLTSLVDVYVTFVVGSILLDLVKERSVDLTLAITILAFVLGIGALGKLLSHSMCFRNRILI